MEPPHTVSVFVRYPHRERLVNQHEGLPQWGTGYNMTVTVPSATSRLLQTINISSKNYEICDDVFKRVTQPLAISELSSKQLELRPIRLVLVFPKKFEFLKLILWLCSEKLLFYLADQTPVHGADNKLADIHTYELGIRNPTSLESTYYLEVLVINNSDIGFNAYLSAHLSFSSAWRCNYLVVGSCGAVVIDPNNPACANLGEVFWITKATKCDRGELNEDGKFVSRPEKLVDQQPRWPDISTKIRQKTCLSGNCLMEKVPIDGRDDSLVEMETYDFFGICSLFSKRVQHFGAVRFVSDIVFPYAGRSVVSDNHPLFSADNYRSYAQQSGQKPEVLAKLTDNLHNSRNNLRKEMAVNFSFLFDFFTVADERPETSFAKSQNHNVDHAIQQIQQKLQDKFRK